MITKNKHSKAGYIARLLALPLFLFTVSAFTIKTKLFKSEILPAYSGDAITVVIDAGHGGNDFGAEMGGKYEKDITLAIVKKVKELNTNEKIKIILSRENDDVYISPPQRVEFTKKNKADCFVSVHVNKFDSESPIKSGLVVYIPRSEFPNVEKCRVLASALINQFTGKYSLPVSPNPFQRTKGIWVLQDNDCPAALIEAGFIDNKKDLAFLQSDEGHKSIAINILAALEKYATSRNEPGASKEIGNAPSSFNSKAGIPEAEKANKSLAKETSTGIDEAFEKNPVIKKDESEKTNVVKAASLRNDISSQNVSVLKGNQFLTNDTTPPLQIVSFIPDKNSKIITPLYIIDGVPKTEIEMKKIPGEDIESITVLKDEAASVIYGPKAKDGVILVVTKKGQTGSATNADSKNRSSEALFTDVETEAAFPGGQDSWKIYLMKNLDASIPAKEGWKKGNYKIVVQFVVEKDGIINRVKAVNYEGSKTADHCISLIKNGPKWSPAQQNGQAVSSIKNQPITFVVE